MDWPKKYKHWIKGRTLYVSIPFTWELQEVIVMLRQKSFFWDRAVVGGPAAYLMPDYFSELDYVSIEHSYPGILQIVNPMATRTTVGCVNHCGFCGVPKVEPIFCELDDWPDFPIICDNNLLAASQQHFDRVIDRLVKWKWADFNQGLDARLLTEYHAKRLAEINNPMIRLALDSSAEKEQWEVAFSLLRSAGIAKSKVRSYVLIGFNSDPSDAWSRCEWIESHGVMALPMWFHPLNALKKNQVTKKQKDLGWNDYERRRIMQWFYQHKMAVV